MIVAVFILLAVIANYTFDQSPQPVVAAPGPATEAGTGPITVTPIDVSTVPESQGEENENVGAEEQPRP